MRGNIYSEGAGRDLGEETWFDAGIGCASSTPEDLTSGRKCQNHSWREFSQSRHDVVLGVYKPWQSRDESR